MKSAKLWEDTQAQGIMCMNAVEYGKMECKQLVVCN